MSGTTQVDLSTEQRAWANAFIRLMGGTTFGKPGNKRSRRTGGPLQGRLQTERQRINAPTLGRDELSGKDEDVTRKTTFGRSTDKGFRTKVMDVVDQFLQEVDDLIAGGPGPEINQHVEDLRLKLQQQRASYNEALKKKDTPKKTDQRGRKVQAIDDRLKALDRFEIDLLISAQERQIILSNLNDRERAQALLDNPEIRRKVIESRPQPNELAKLFTSTTSNKQDELLKDILDIHGKDQGYLMEVAREATVIVTANEDRNAYMRGNSAGSKLLRDICLSCESTQELTQMVGTDATDWAKSVGLIEVESDKMDGMEPRARQDAIEVSAQAIRDLVTGTLNKIYQMEVAPEIKATAKIAADQFIRKFPDATQKELSAIISGHVFLRIVSPAIINAAGALAPRINELAKKKKEKTSEYKLLIQQQRALTLAAKVMQNIGNGTKPGDKEPAMRVFDDLIDQVLGDMQNYCLSIIA
jgi:GTPase-activator protein for Ras-like GTPase